MTIKQLKQKYKKEWVLAEVLEEDELHNPTKVKVITHSKNREEVYDALLKVKAGLHVATLFTGKFPAKGYAVAFFGFYDKQD